MKIFSREKPFESDKDQEENEKPEKENGPRKLRNRHWKKSTIDDTTVTASFRPFFVIIKLLKWADHKTKLIFNGLAQKIKSVKIKNWIVAAFYLKSIGSLKIPFDFCINVFLKSRLFDGAAWRDKWAIWYGPYMI